MDKRAEEVSRGHEAKRIVDSSLFQEAFDTYQTKLFKAWQQTGAGDLERREQIWLAYQLAGKVKQHLTDTITTGKMAEKQIEDLWKSN